MPESVAPSETSHSPRRALTISHQGLTENVAVVSLSGRATLGSLSEELVTVTERFLKEGRRIIILDLAGVTAIDSTGIGLVISTYNKIIGAQGQIRIAGAAGHLLDVFHVSRLDTVFPLYTTVEDAVRS
jgi:anti-anti-sigma factor